ncbi:MAG: hypothetical protein PHP35_02735 [Candidatus Colwellbacteria bacterium]|nr:hypothetical protein [Candidatus Colwellbacteria bacterium]
MIILLSGNDSYRRKKHLDAIVGQFKEKHGSSNLRFFGPDDDLSLVVDFIRGRSMFDPLGMAVMDIGEAITASDDRLKAFNNCLKRASSDREMTVIISSDEEISEELGLSEEDIFKSWVFDSLKGKELESFIGKEAISRGLKLTPSNIASLISLFGNDLWSISTEIDRLIMSDGEIIEDKFAGVSYFSIINSLKSGKTAGEKLVALELLITKLKEDPARVFNGLAYSAPRGVDPETWFRRMADYDIAVKSGKMDYMEALTDFAIRWY